MNEEPTIRSDVTIKLIDHYGNDESIAQAAWVSSKGAEAVAEQGKTHVGGLIRSLMRAKHGTPFEHAGMKFFVEAPIFVFREWHRHRIGFSYNEMSMRYLKRMPGVFWAPAADRPLIKVGKGMAPQFEPGTPEQRELTDRTFQECCNFVWERYGRLVDAGIANEVAARVLGVNIYSAMVVTCNPRSLMAFLSLRTGRDEAQHRSYPQREIEQCADALEAEFARLFPITHAAYCEFKRVAP